MGTLGQKLGNPLSAILLLFGAGLLVISFPYLASAYHLEAAGRALANPTRLTASPGTPEQGPLLALEHLLRSSRWDPSNAQAYRLLGQVHRMQGNWPAAVEAMIRYVELRPRDPLAHFELAELHEEIETELAMMQLAAVDQSEEADKQLAILEAMDPGTGMIQAWRRAGLTAETIIAWARKAHKTGQDDAAEKWLKRAAQLEPGSSEPRYHLGLLYEDQERWLEALESYRRAATSTTFKDLPRSSPSYRAGLVQQLHLDPPQMEQAGLSYTQALEAGDFGSLAEAADCHYRRGDVLRIQQAGPSEYIPDFERAIELDPRHGWAHARLGQAFYALDGDASRAESEILKALALNPNSKWIHVILGDLYRDEDRFVEAAAAYQRALEIDPYFEAAATRVQLLSEGEQD
jgi:tetratricopeptide (TPR) repeat protein